MSYRYNTVDIIVGVGMCAILFGALLLFMAADGTYQVPGPQALSYQEDTGFQVGMNWLQPVLGQTVVDEALFERRTNQLLAQSISEWNRATVAEHDFRSFAGNPFGAVRQQADTMPADHQARVQGVMGRAIVNGTRRGIGSGALSADLYLSDYNSQMIRTVEMRGQHLDQEFTSTWQAMLGRNIVDAFQRYQERAAVNQERIGTALVHLAQIRQAADEGRAAIQSQLASLVVAAVRTQALSDRLTLLAAIQSFPEDTRVASTEPASLPEIPVGFLAAAGFLLMAVFFGAITLAAQRREAKAQADMQYSAARWTYRHAA